MIKAPSSRFSAASSTMKGGRDILETLGIDEATLAAILSMGSEYIFDSGDTWSAAVPHTKSMTASLMKSILELNSSANQNVVTMFTPLLGFYNNIKATKERIGFKLLPAPARDAVDAVLLSAPAYSLDTLNKDNIESFTLDRFSGTIHPLVTRLMP